MIYCYIINKQQEGNFCNMNHIFQLAYAQKYKNNVTAEERLPLSPSSPEST